MNHRLTPRTHRHPFVAARLRRLRSAFKPICLAAGLALFAGQPWALPTGAVVGSGQAKLGLTAPGQLLVTQTTAQAGIDWQSFSIAAGERVRIQQPSASAVLFNRVTGLDPSVILGQMQANGRVFLSNPRGILFGAGSQVDVGGLVATTLNLQGVDALTGRYQLLRGADSPGALRVEGDIRAPGGTVALVGPDLSQRGHISAARVGLAAAGAVQVDLDGDGLIFFNLRPEGLDGRLSLLGNVLAEGGSAEARATARAGFADSVLNLDGVVRARGLRSEGGKVVIDGGGAGVVRVAGRVDADGERPGQRGGSVALLGDLVQLDPGAQVSADGPAGGGAVYVGGGWQGKDPSLHNARALLVREGARLSASATERGDGGRVVLWSDGTTVFDGAVAASGGAQGGRGGQVETSGKQALGVGTGQVNIGGRDGGGTWLLDPANIEVNETTGTATYAQVATLAGSSGDQVVKASVLTAQAGAVTLAASNNITINSDVAMPFGASSLSLTGGGSGQIAVNANLSTTNAPIALTSGSGGITLASGKSINPGTDTIALNGGGGNVILTGALTTLNTTASAIAISNAANVQLGNVAAGAGGVITTTFTGTGSQAAGSAITQGALTMAGTGTLTLTGTNTYTGTTTINTGGTLQLGNGGTTGSVASTAIVDNGTLVVNRGNAVTLAAVVSGSGGLTMAGTDTLTLSGPNTYSGATSITSGILSIAADSALGTAPGVATPGHLAIAGGTLQTTANVTLNSNRGVALGNATPGSGGTIDVANAGQTLTYNGVIADAGAPNTLTKTGPGTLALGGDNIYTGGTSVNGGALNITAGSLVAAPMALNGGALGGPAAVSVTTLTSTGTSEVTTAVTPTSTSDTAIQVTGGNLTVSGSGKLNGNVTVASGATLTSSTLTDAVGDAAKVSVNGTWAASSAPTETIGTLALTSSGSVTGNVAATGNIALNNSSITSNLTGGSLTNDGNSTVTGATITVSTNGGTTSGVATLNANSTLKLTDATLAPAGGVQLSDGSTLTFEPTAAPATVGYAVTNVAGQSTGQVQKTGSNTLTLTNPANDWSGGTTVSAGTLALGAADVLPNTGQVVVNGSTAVLAVGANTDTIASLRVAGGASVTGTGTLTVNDAAGLSMEDGSVSAKLAGNAALTKTTSGTVTLSGVNTYTGGTTVSDGTLSMGASNVLPDSGAVVVNGSAAVLAVGANTDTIASLRVAGGASITGTGTLTVTDANGLLMESGSVAAALAGSTALTKSTNGTVTLGSANTYTGKTTISQGVLSIGADGALGTPPAEATPGHLALDGGTLQATSTMTLDARRGIALGNGTAGSGGTIEVTNPLQTLTYNGAVANAGTSNTLTKTGPGTLALGGANTYSGGTSVNGGALNITAGSLVAAPMALNVGALGGPAAVSVTTLTSTGTSLVTTVVTPTSAADTAVQVSGGALTVSGSGKLNGNVTVASGATLTSSALTDAVGNAAKVSVNGTWAASTAPTEAIGTLVLGTSGVLTGNVSATGNIALNNSSITSNLTGGSLTNDGNSTVTGATITVSTNGGTTSGVATLNANSTLKLTNATLAPAGGVQLSDGSTLTFEPTAAPATVGYAITNVAGQSTGQVQKTGSNTLTLTNPANDWSGGTTVSAGTLALGAADVLPNAGPVVVNGSTAVLAVGANTDTIASLRVAGGASVTGTGTLTVNDAAGLSMEDGSVSAKLAGNAALTKTTSGTVTLSGVNTYTGGTTVSDGTLTMGASNVLPDSGAVVVNGIAAVLAVGANTDAIASLRVAGGASVTGTGTLTVNDAAGLSMENGSVSAKLAGNAALTKTTTGTLTLSGVNTYTGGTTVSDGTLTMGASNVLPDGSAVVVNGGAAVLAVGANTDTIASLRVAGGASVTGTGTLTVTNANGLLMDSGSVAAALTGNTALTKSTNGTVTLGGVNTYTGKTTISGGVLSIGADSALGAAPGGLTPGHLEIDGGTLRATANMTLNSNRGVALGNAAVASGGTIDVANAGQTLTYNGVVVNAGTSNTLTKTGPGSLTLGGTNTYTGTTTIGAGNLTLSGGAAISDNGAVVLADGVGATLTLAGSETIGSLAGGAAVGGNGAGVVALGGNTLTTGASGSTTFAGGIGGSGGLTKAGSATTFTLSGSNSYIGATLVSAGTLRLASGQAIADSGAVTVSATPGANLTVDVDETIAALTLNGGSVNGAGLLTTATLTANASASINSALTATNSALVSAGTLTVNGPAGKLSAPTTVAAGATLQTVGTADGLGDASALTVGGTLTVAGAERSGTLALSGTLNGAGSLTVGSGQISGGTVNTALSADTTVNSSGASTVNAPTLAGTSITVDAGSLTVNGSAGTLGAPLIAVEGGGAQLLTTAAGRLVSSSTLQVANGGRVELAGAENVAGLTDKPAQTPDGSAVLVLGDQVLTVNITGAGTSQVFTGSVQGSALGGLVKDGAGQLTLAGSNTLAGTTTVNAGNLTLSGGAAVNDSAAVVLADGVTATLTLASDETIGSLAGGAAVGGAGAGVVALGANTLVTGGGGSTSFAGAIGGSGGLTKAGSASNFTLSGSNTYTGATLVNAGGLTLSGGSALSDTTAVTMAPGVGATLTLNSSETIGSLAGGAAVGGAGAGVVALNNNSLTTGGNGDSTDFAGGISGSGGLTKTGIGAFRLSGVNSYTGATLINDGTLRLASGQAIADSAAVTVSANPGAYLTVDINETIAALTLNGGNVNGAARLTTGTLTVNGSASISAAVTATQSAQVNAGTLTINGLSGKLSAPTTVAAGATLQTVGTADGLGDAFALTVDGTLTVGGAERSGTLALSGTLNGAGSLTVGSGQISGGTVNTALTADTTLNSSGASTVNAPTLAGTSITVDAGSLTVNGSAGSLGAPLIAVEGGGAQLLTTAAGRLVSSSTLQVANGGRVELAGAENVAGLTDKPSQTPDGSAVLALGDQVLTVNLAGAGSSQVFTGSVQGSALGGLIKDGAGRLTLAGSNTLAGTTTVNAGNLRLSGGAAINDSAAVVLADGVGATLTLAGSETIGSLAGGAAVGGTGAGVVALNNNTLTTGGNGHSTDFAGGISGSGGLTKTGSGIFTLSGVNSYTGATLVNDGTLRLASGQAIADSGAVTVSATPGANLTVDVAETIAALTLNGGSVNGAGLLTTATLAANASASINAAITATQSAQVNAGTLTINGPAGKLSAPTTVAAGATLQTVGTADGLGDASALTVDGTLTVSGAERSGTLVLAGTLNGAGSLTVGNGQINGGTVNTALTADTTLNSSGASTVNAPTLAGTSITVDAGSLTVNGGAGTLGAPLIAVEGGGARLVTSAAGRLVSSSTLQVANGGRVELAGVENVAGLTDKPGQTPDGSAVVALGDQVLTVNLAGAGSSQVFTGSVQGSALGGLVKDGAGRLTLAGSNTLAGTSTVNAGNLRLSGGAAINDSAAVVLADGVGATLTLAGSETIGSLAGGAAVGGTGAGVVALNNNTLTTGGNGHSTDFAGGISGSGGLTKAGSGIFTLSGVNSYTGATLVSAGTLRLASGQAIADSAAVTVSATPGANLTVDADETIAALTLSGGSVNGAGLLTTATLTANASASINSALTATNSALVSAGTLTINGPAGKLSAPTTVAAGATLQTVGTADGLGDASALTIDGTLTVGGAERSGTLALSGTLNGSGSLTVGSGQFNGGTVNTALTADTTLRSSGASTVNAPTLAGTSITVDAGSLTVNASAGTLGAPLIAVEGGGARLLTTAAGRLVSSSTLQVANGGRVELAGAENLAGLTDNPSQTPDGSAVLALGDQVLTVNLAGAGASQVFTGSVQGSALAGLVKDGAGRLTLAGANTYAGLTQVADGTLATAAVAGRFNPAGRMQVDAPATLQLGADEATQSLLLDGTLRGPGRLTVAGLTQLNSASSGSAANVDGPLTTQTLQSRGNAALNGVVTTGIDATVADGRLSIGLGGRLDAPSVKVNGGSLASASGHADAIGDATAVDVASGAALALGGAERFTTLNLNGGSVENAGNAPQRGSLTVTDLNSSGTTALNVDTTVTGTARITPQVLTIGSGVALNANQLNVVAGARLSAAGASGLAGTQTLLVDTGSTLDVTATQNVQTLLLNGSLTGVGSVNAGTQAVLNGGTVSNGTAGSAALTTPVLSSSGASTIASTVAVTDHATVAAGSLTLASGGTLAAPLVTVNSGATLATAVGGVLGSGNTLAVVGGATLQLDGAQSIDTLNLSGTLAGPGAMTATRGVALNGGAVNTALTSTGSFSSDGASTTRAPLTASAQPLTVRSGSLTLLAGGSLNAAVVDVAGGTLASTVANQLPAAATLNVASGATLNVGAADRAAQLNLAGTLAGSGALTVASASLDGGQVGAPLSASGTLQSQGASTLGSQVNAGGLVTVTGGSLTLDAQGRLSAPAAGIDVQAGRLVTLAAARIDQATPLQVRSGATAQLGGAETVAALTLGGTLDGPGALTVSGATALQQDGLVNTTLHGATLGSDGVAGIAAAVDLSGRAAVNSGTLNLAAGGSLKTPQIDVATGSALTTSAASQLAGSGAVQVAAGAALNLAAAETVASLQLAGSLNGNGVLNAGSATLNGAGVNAALNVATLDNAAGASQLNAAVAASTTAKVSAGTLTVGAQGLLGAPLVVVANGATLATAAAQRLAASNALQVANGGTLSLGGDQTLASLADLTGQASDGSARVALNAFGLSTGASNADTAFGGVLTGSGSLAKQGSGVFTLTGNNSYSGSTEVAAGTLQVGAGGAGGASGSLGSGDVRNNAQLRYQRSGTATVDNAITGSGSLEQASGAGSVLVLSSARNAYTGKTLVSSGTLRTSGAERLPDASAVEVKKDGRLELGGDETMQALTTDAGSTAVLGGSVTSTLAQAYGGVVQVSASTPITLTAPTVTAENTGNQWGTRALSVVAGQLRLHGGVDNANHWNDLVLGTLRLNGNGDSQIEAGTLVLGEVGAAPATTSGAAAVVPGTGLLALSSGTLTLVAQGTPTYSALGEAGVVEPSKARPIALASAVIGQTEGSLVDTGAGSLLVLRSRQGGSLSLGNTGNRFAGAVQASSVNDENGEDFGRPWSANAGTVGGVETARQSVITLGGDNVRVGGKGLDADLVRIDATTLATVDGSLIRARMYMDNSAFGFQQATPGLRLKLGSASFTTADSWGSSTTPISVSVGEAQAGEQRSQKSGGFVQVLPKNGLQGSTAVYLKGPTVSAASYSFFYDGAAIATEIPVIYNNVLPATPELTGSLSAVAAVSDQARRERFEEAVRTENVAVRLRTGIIAEVGPGRPATQGSQGAREPESCSPPAGGNLRCEEVTRTENVSGRLRSGVIKEVGKGRAATEGEQGAAPPAECEPGSEGGLNCK